MISVAVFPKVESILPFFDLDQGKVQVVDILFEKFADARSFLNQDKNGKDLLE